VTEWQDGRKTSDWVRVSLMTFQISGWSKVCQQDAWDAMVAGYRNQKRAHDASRTSRKHFVTEGEQRESEGVLTGVSLETCLIPRRVVPRV